jgi:hypothetical protein
MGMHAFVDETTQGGLVLAVALVEERDLAAVRSVMRALCLPGQFRIHFKKENHGRRGRITSAICGTGVAVDLYDARRRTMSATARLVCLERLVADLAEQDCHRLVIEQVDSYVHTDQGALFAAAREAAVSQSLTYEHLPPRSEPLLWIPDAAAWCWTHGEEWRRRINPMVRRVTKV